MAKVSFKKTDSREKALEESALEENEGKIYFVLGGSVYSNVPPEISDLEITE